MEMGVRIKISQIATIISSIEYKSFFSKPTTLIPLMRTCTFQQTDLYAFIAFSVTFKVMLQFMD